MSFGHFTIHQPSSTAEACQLGLKFGHKSAYLAGGTELLVDLRSGRKSVCHVISMEKLDELKKVSIDGDELCIGSMVTLSEVGDSAQVRDYLPALSDAIQTMAGRQIRNRGTIGGNFCCGVPCSDIPPIACAVDANLVLTGPDGTRTIAAREFVLAPRVTVRNPEEILSEIRIPRQTPGSGSSFQRFALRRGMALAVASVAARIVLQDGVISEARIFLGSVGPVPLLADEASSSLLGLAPSREIFDKAGVLASSEAQPISDLRGSEQYRRDVVAVLTGRALAQAIDRAEGKC